MPTLSRPALVVLVILGLLIACCSLAALAYALWPLSGISIQATVSPTLLAPP
jgi:hypothetical protein